ncbi:MAG: hypothetical protein R2787_15930 [Saprospiraceae bacterium]
MDFMNLLNMWRAYFLSWQKVTIPLIIPPRVLGDVRDDNMRGMLPKTAVAKMGLVFLLEVSLISSCE